MIARTLVCVFREWSYSLIAITIAACIFVFATWLPNLGLVWQIVVSQSVPLLYKFEILASLVGSIATNFTIFSAVYMSAIAVLFGMNAAMIVYYMKQRRSTATRTGAAGLGGLLSGFVGIGCAACGTFVLGPVLSFIGAAGLIAVLPFAGQEFGVLGVGLLGVSVYLVARKIAKPPACPMVFDSALRTNS